jgi:carbon monoxide dehydrogenase subunit G
MAIKFNGEFHVPRQPEEVYDFLIDPNRFAPLLPEFQSLSIEDATRFTVKVNVGVSHIKGAANVKMELAHAERPKSAQYKGQGSVAGGNVSLTALFDLSVADGGTKVLWQGEAQIFGRLTSLAGGLLEPLGRKNAQKLIDGLRAALTVENILSVSNETTGSTNAFAGTAAPNLTEPGSGDAHSTEPAGTRAEADRSNPEAASGSET